MALRRIRPGLILAQVLALAPAGVVMLPAPAGAPAHGSARPAQLAAERGDGRPRVPATLAWRPPRLVDPIRLRITRARDLELDPTRDYILELPRHRPLIADYGCIHIVGGHNVVLIGGECYVPLQTDPTEGSGRAFYVEGNTGTVHIEGLVADGPGLTEGVDIFDSPHAVLQVENCRFATVHNWGISTIHSDLVQADSLAQLRIDRFTGSSQVQGIFRDGADPAPAGADLRHVNIAGVRGGTAGRLLWNGSGHVRAYRMKLSNVYIRPFPGDSIGADVWPGVGQPPRFAPRLSQGSLEWPEAARISGSVHTGLPAGGDYVPAGSAGLAYVSPGYSPATRRR